MSENDFRIQNAVKALKLGLIDWFKFFEIIRSIN